MGKCFSSKSQCFNVSEFCKNMDIFVRSFQLSGSNCEKKLVFDYFFNLFICNFHLNETNVLVLLVLHIKMSQKQKQIMNLVERKPNIPFT